MDSTNNTYLFILFINTFMTLGKCNDTFHTLYMKLMTFYLAMVLLKFGFSDVNLMIIDFNKKKCSIINS